MKCALALAALLLIAAACSHSSTNAASTPSAAASATPSASTPTPATGIENLVVPQSVRTSLTSAFVAAKQIPPSDVEGTEPGSVYYALDHSTGIHWALATFVPSKTASQQTLVGFQDGGNAGMFKMEPGGAWMVKEPEYPPICLEVKFFPADVMAAWHISTQTPPDCQGAGDDFAPFAGQWNRHGFSITIQPNGSGTATWRIYKNCSDDPTPPCDSVQGNQIHSGGNAAFQLTSLSGSSAKGDVSQSSDQKTVPVGPLQVEFIGNDHMRFGGMSDQFCRAYSQATDCGA